MNPMASLTVTYLVSAAVSALLYFALGRGGSLLREYSKLSPAPFLFGVVLVGLEVLREVLDLLREDRDLHVAGPGVLFVLPELGADGFEFDLAHGTE